MRQWPLIMRVDLSIAYSGPNNINLASFRRKVANFMENQYVIDILVLFRQIKASLTLKQGLSRVK